MSNDITKDLMQTRTTAEDENINISEDVASEKQPLKDQRKKETGNIKKILDDDRRCCWPPELH
jgi:hypothetical protein